MLSERIRIREKGVVHCSECGNEKVFRVQAEEVDENEYSYSVMCDICGKVSDPVATEPGFSPRFDKISLLKFVLAMNNGGKYVEINQDL